MLQILQYEGKDGAQGSAVLWVDAAVGSREHNASSVDGRKVPDRMRRQEERGRSQGSETFTNASSARHRTVGSAHRHGKALIEIDTPVESMAMHRADAVYQAASAVPALSKVRPCQPRKREGTLRSLSRCTRLFQQHSAEVRVPPPQRRTHVHSACALQPERLFSGTRIKSFDAGPR